MASQAAAKLEHFDCPYKPCKFRGDEFQLCDHCESAHGNENSQQICTICVVREGAKTPDTAVLELHEENTTKTPTLRQTKCCMTKHRNTRTDDAEKQALAILPADSHYFQ